MSHRGVSSLEQVEVIFRNDAVYELAALIPEPSHELGGRRISYPPFMLIAYEALITVYRSAASGGRHARKPRVERTVLVGPGTIRHADGTTRDAILYTEAGALCLGELTTNGEITLIPLERTKIEPRRNADNTWRWYGVFIVPDHAGGGTLRVRLDTTDEDQRRGFNRAEHLRPIPPSDPEYRELYARRADAESINRALDDSHWLARAHSVGRDRQLLNLLGYAIAVNSIALHRHRRTNAPPQQLAA